MKVWLLMCWFYLRMLLFKDVFFGKMRFFLGSFFLVSFEGFFMFLFCVWVLFFLCWVCFFFLDVVIWLLDFLVFFFFIDFCIGMWGLLLWMVFFRLDRVFFWLVVIGVISCMFCWGVWDFRGIMYVFCWFRIFFFFWVFFWMIGMKFFFLFVWWNCFYNEGFEM